MRDFGPAYLFPKCGGRIVVSIIEETPKRKQLTAFRFPVEKLEELRADAKREGVTVTAMVLEGLELRRAVRGVIRDGAQSGRKRAKGGPTAAQSKHRKRK